MHLIFFFFTAKPAAGERERENKPHRCAFHLFFPKTVATYFSSRRRGLENANDQNFAVSLLGAIPENLFQSQPDSHSKSRIVLLLNCSSGGGVSVRGRVCPISYEKGNLLADIKSGTVQRGDPYLTNHSNPRIYHDTALNKRSYIVIQHGHSVLKASLSPDKNTEKELSSLLSPDWCSEVCDITFSPLNPTQYKPVRKNSDKYTYLSCEIAKTVPTFGSKLCPHVGAFCCEEKTRFQGL